MLPPTRTSTQLAAGALLFAAAAGLRAQDDLDADVRHALDNARPALLAHLRAVAVDARPGELALVLLAAIHDGVAEDDEVFGKAVQRLQKANPEQTYDFALRLLVLEALPSFPGREKLAAADTKELLKHRDRNGGFSYEKSSGRWDLSNTQYGALGLRAGKALGADVDRTVWSKMAQEIGEQQDSYGGFGYAGKVVGLDNYASMTAAGIAVLAICRQHLGGAHKDLDQRIERGWQWFARHADTIGSSTERWSFYFHYGLERAAILTDVVTVGNDDWYRKGARMLVQQQLPGGGWRSATDGYQGSNLDRGRGDGVPTAFAILFLRRKFQKDVAPITPHIVRLVNIGPRSPQKDVDACAQQLVQLGMAAVPDVLQALRSEIEPQRRAAAQALQAIAGEAFGYDAARDAADNRDAVRAAELWYLRHR
jgi:hypothetical protein